MSEDEPKRVQIKVSAGAPIELPIEIKENVDGLPTEKRDIMRRVGETFRAYLRASTQLLKGKYAKIKDIAPVHLRDPGRVLAMCCNEGIIVRYDRHVGEKQLMTAWSDEELPDLAPKLSESVVFCHTNKDYVATIPKVGPELILTSTDASTGQQAVISKLKLRFDAVLSVPPSPETLTAFKRPYRLLSVQNSIEIQMLGEICKNGQRPGEGARFLTRTPLRLPVGWECIEVYPSYQANQWTPDLAELWAENEILAGVVAYQLREREFSSLDPNAAARKKFNQVLSEFQGLLISVPEREEVLQRFLKDHPILLCPAHRKIWPKLPFGARESDFVIQDAVGDYLLVELEQPSFPLFLGNGDTSSQLKHAQNQVLDWKRYIEDNLPTVQKELGLVGISSHPKSLIVIGRSLSLSAENRRKLATIENESPKTKIITYDDVLENAKAIGENIFGPFWGEMGNTEVYYLS